MRGPHVEGKEKKPTQQQVRSKGIRGRQEGQIESRENCQQTGSQRQVATRAPGKRQSGCYRRDAGGHSHESDPERGPGRGPEKSRSRRGEQRGQRHPIRVGRVRQSRGIVQIIPQEWFGETTAGGELYSIGGVIIRIHVTGRGLERGNRDADRKS